MMLVLMNHLELTTESKRTKLSIMRFYTVGLAERSIGHREVSYLVTLF